MWKKTQCSRVEWIADGDRGPPSHKGGGEQEYYIRDRKNRKFEGSPTLRPVTTKTKLGRETPSSASKLVSRERSKGGGQSCWGVGLEKIGNLGIFWGTPH